MRRGLHIGWLWSGIVLMLLTVGCSSDDNGMEEKQPTMLTVYVYSPDHPLLIRSAVREVNPSVEESKITRLQIWIFEHTDEHKPVAYFDTNETSLLSVGEGAIYQIPVSDDFAQRKPDVDVYVIANLPEGEYGNTLNSESTRANILAATIPEGYYGLTTPTTQVPSTGLPMSGSLMDQPVVGEAPVLRVGSATKIATVQLTRCVSKVRFVFANTKGTAQNPAPELIIKGITMNAEMIPQQEYLIVQDKEDNELTYNTEVKSLFTGSSEAPFLVNETQDPTKFIYDGREAQAYEDYLDEYIYKAEPELSQLGPYYLRESDQQLSGTILYQIGNVDKPAMSFQMEQAGDFLRNHTWIVYAYYVGGGYLQLDALYVKNWNLDKSKEHEVYNW